MAVHLRFLLVPRYWRFQHLKQKLNFVSMVLPICHQVKVPTRSATIQSHDRPNSLVPCNSLSPHPRCQPSRNVSMSCVPVRWVSRVAHSDLSHRVIAKTTAPRLTLAGGAGVGAWCCIQSRSLQRDIGFRVDVAFFLSVAQVVGEKGVGSCCWGRHSLFLNPHHTALS